MSRLANTECNLLDMAACSQRLNPNIVQSQEQYWACGNEQ
jgi:hypothetical protein